jgi:hypothetical protein
MNYVYAWTAHPDKGGKLQRGVPKYSNGCGWKPVYDSQGKPIYVKVRKAGNWYERLED